MDYKSLARDGRFKLMGNRILIERDSVPETTQGGIYLLGREFPCRGTVLAVGSGRRFTSNGGYYWLGGRQEISDLKAGDEVSWLRYDWERWEISRSPDLAIFPYDNLELRFRPRPVITNGNPLLQAYVVTGVHPSLKKLDLVRDERRYTAYVYETKGGDIEKKYKIGDVIKWTRGTIIHT